jgi:hypothetical protein
MIAARHLDQTRTRNPLGKMSAAREPDAHVVGAMKHEGRTSMVAF